MKRFLSFISALTLFCFSLNAQDVSVTSGESSLSGNQVGSGSYYVYLSSGGVDVYDIDEFNYCPKCGAKLLKKVSKKGKKFYGCSNYPNCDFAAPGIPTGEKCSECGGYLIKCIRGKAYCMNGDCPTRKNKKANNDE